MEEISHRTGKKWNKWAMVERFTESAMRSLGVDGIGKSLPIAG